MPNYIRVKQINQSELTGFFVDSISSQSGLLLAFASGAASGVASGAASNSAHNRNGPDAGKGMKNIHYINALFS